MFASGNTGKNLDKSARRVTALAAVLLFSSLLLVACASNPPTRSGVDGKRILQADTEPGNWMSHGRTYDEQRYSPLDTINETNIDRLGLSWRYDFDTHLSLIHI